MNITDSNTNIVPINKIFEIRNFYDVNYTDYCASFGPKIKLLFDLNVGTAYEKAMDMKVLEDGSIKFKGNAHSMLEMYDKILACPDYKVECTMKVGDSYVPASRDMIIPQYLTSPIQKFILEKGTNIVKDLSEYELVFKKIG